jgi:Bacterial Ig-like domain (group 3)/MBG domain (YGX type)/FG-GAP-like repeat
MNLSPVSREDLIAAKHCAKSSWFHVSKLVVFDRLAETFEEKMSNPLKHSQLLVLSELDRYFVQKEFIQPLFWAVVFCLFLISPMAGAQSSTATTLSATSSGTVSGSIVTMTANVSSSGQPVTGGTVTFRDTYAAAAQDLGTIQVQSANGTAGTAVLATEVGGVGAHSIVAIYNAPKAYTTSASAPVALTFQSPYSSATALAMTGSGGTYTLTGTLSAFGPMQPTGSLTFTDTTTTPNTTIGKVALDPTTATLGFTPPTLYQIPTAPFNSYSMGTPVSGDFNGDGHPDFAIPTSLGPVMIMLGHGDGTFQQGASISATQPFGAVEGDFNGDGKLDLAIANRGTSSIAIYLGNGDGTFQAGDVYPAASGADYQILALGDFNRDGIPDLVVSDHAHDQVAVLLGNGDGTFQSASLFATGPEPWNLAIGDINGDGNPDLVVANDANDAQGDNITLLLGNGDGTFKPATYLIGGVTSSGSVALADFNGDGILDIAATEEPGNSVFVFLGNGDGTFQPKTTYPMTKGPFYITVGDFNQDGKKDIITANAEGDSVGVLLGNGDGTFRAAKIYPAGGAVIYADVQDFNGDNQADVVAVTQNGLQVYLAGNAQTAQFSPFTVIGCNTQSIVATYNGDTNYATSTSPVASVSQNGLATTISVVQTPQNPVYGQAVTLTATLTPYVNGSFSSDIMPVTFFDGSTSLGTAKLSGGVASLPITPSTGPHSFTAVYGGACALTGSTSLADVATVGKATPTITWANPGPIVYGVTLSAAQLNATASVPGTLTYTPAIGATPLVGTDTLSVSFTPTDSTDYATTTSTAQITVSPAVLIVTAQDAKRPYGAANPAFGGKITGAFAGDTFTESFTTAATSTSAPGTYAIVPSVTGTNLAQYTQSVTNGTLTITKAASTSSIVPSATSVSPGQNVTLTAQVVSATSGTPTGTVTFSNNGNLLGTATLTNGTATYSAITLPLGNNVITANYSGDDNFNPNAADSSSVTVALNVLTIAADNSTRVYGASNPVFTGKITGTQSGDTFAESFSTAATLTSAPGTYAIVPSATGADLAKYTQSVENGTLTIAKASVTSSIVLSTTSVTQGQNVGLTANVVSTTSGTPTGTVNFFYNGSPLGTATLTNGKATYSTTTLPLGNDVITFTYSGDANFTANTAASATGTNTVIVSAPIPLDFALQMTSPSSGLTGNYGASVQVKLHVAPTAGQFPGTVQFAVTGTPAVPATYTFSPATVGSAAGPTDVTMTIQLQALTSRNAVPTNSGRLAPIVLGLLVLPWLSLRRMQRSGRQLGKSLGMTTLCLAIFGAAITITGCGGGSSPTPNPSNLLVSDSIVVNATSGSVQHSVTVNLAVQKAQ